MLFCDCFPNLSTIALFILRKNGKTLSCCNNVVQPRILSKRFFLSNKNGKQITLHQWCYSNILNYTYKTIAERRKVFVYSLQIWRTKTLTLKQKIFEFKSFWFWKRRKNLQEDNFSGKILHTRRINLPVKIPISIQIGCYSQKRHRKK